MNLFYASSITYPSTYANRLQVLYTAEALARAHTAFVLGCNALDPKNGIYTHAVVAFLTARSPLLAWKQLSYMRRNAVDTVYCREHALLFLLMVYNRVFFRLPLRFFYEAHTIHPGRRFDFVIKHSAHVFCITNGLGLDLKKRYPATSMSTLPDGVDVEAFTGSFDKKAARVRYGLPQDAFIATYVGSVDTHHWKGVDVFLESQTSMDESVLCVVAGAEKAERVRLEALYDPRALRVMERVDRKAAVELMRLSDVLVLPNRSGPVISERYTSPLKMFEYMASGVPIVASDLPSIREVLGDDSATLVKPNDPSALASAINEVRADSAAARERAERARLLAARYSWNTRARTILAELTT